jgi:hypothetical protein
VWGKAGTFIGFRSASKEKIQRKPGFRSEFPSGMARRRTEEGNGNTDLRAPIVSDREKREEGACAGGLKHELGRGEGIEPSVGEPGGWVGCGEEGA